MNRNNPARPIAICIAALLVGLAVAWAAGDTQFEQALDLLDERKYQRAYELFQRYIDDGGQRTDAALYWQARAMYKLGRNDRAIARLNRLLADHPGSEWRDDADALLVELRGGAADPADLDDANLKLLALQSVMRQRPQEALPMVKRMIESSEDEGVRQQAMFVLAQAGTPAARQMLFQYATDTKRPQIAVAAIRQIAIFGGAASRGMLSDLYDQADDRQMRETIMDSFMINKDTAKLLQIAHSERDPDLREKAINLLGASGAVRELESLDKPGAPLDVREAVLNAYMISGQRDKLLAAARDDPQPEIREQAVSLLGAIGARTELEQLYREQTDPEARRDLVTALMVTGDKARMLRIAREDRDPEVREEAIRMLGVMGARQELATLRGERPSRDVMEAIITAMMISGDAKGLIEIYNTSRDPEVRSAAVRQLSVMRSEEALQFMLQILKEK